MSRKILIKPSQTFGFYEVILFELQNFLFVKWWKEVSITVYNEDEAFAKVSELVGKYNISSADVYDWSADGFKQEEKVQKPASIQQRNTHFLSYN